MGTTVFVLTLRNPISQSLVQIRCRSITDSLELLVVRNVNVEAQIMRRKAQSDNQSFVTENLLVIAKDRIRELRME